MSVLTMIINSLILKTWMSNVKLYLNGYDVGWMDVLLCVGQILIITSGERE